MPADDATAAEEAAELTPLPTASVEPTADPTADPTVQPGDLATAGEPNPAASVAAGPTDTAAADAHAPAAADTLVTEATVVLPEGVNAAAAAAAVPAGCLYNYSQVDIRPIRVM